MTAKDRVSAVMTARNSEATIRQAITSTLRALGSKDELLVLLDDPQDQTEGVVRSINDPRLQVEVNSKNIGINASRNRLLGLASGPLVSVIDADDISLRWRYAVSRKLIAEGADIVFGTAIVFGRQLRPLPLLPQYPFSLDNHQARLALLVANPFVHSSMTGRLDAIRSVGGYSSSLSEDYDLWLRLAGTGFQLRRTGLPLVAYRFHSTQESQGDNFMERVWSSEKLVDSYLSFAKQVFPGQISNQTDEARIQSAKLAKDALYEMKPSMRHEHAGLPQVMKRWKNSKAK